MSRLGTWKGLDPATGFHQVELADGRVLKVADLVDDTDAAQRTKVLSALKDPAHKDDRAHVAIIIALGMAKEGSSAAPPAMHPARSVPASPTSSPNPLPTRPRSWTPSTTP
ncbi:hypothetical protein G6F22_020522 [Rhizopus arrhizus]|nr:hypothetical protein G6F22_020522 [Rhizopus arrhizus]